jgi:hypothetical protein
MPHVAIDQVLKRAEQAKAEGDYTYFHSLLVAAEALTKTMVLGIVASIGDDKDRNRYRLEHQLVKADGIGDWSKAAEDALTGIASQYLLADARSLQVELTQGCKQGEWQHDATTALKAALVHLGIEGEQVDIKTDMKRWLRLFALLRNKTRGHGAILPQQCGPAAQHLATSIELIYRNYSLFERPWAYLHRNLSGKYRVSSIAGSDSDFAHLRKDHEAQHADGVYIHVGSPRRVNLMQSDAELLDFYYANGGLGGKSYELLSYYTGNKASGDATAFLTPPTGLPTSETHGHGDLQVQGNCFSNAPEMLRDYISRPTLEAQLRDLLLDDKRHIVTLVGRGGIGKTSLALKVIHELFSTDRYQAVVWLSARDIDLHLSGPKPVKPSVLAPDEMAKVYASLVLSNGRISEKGFKARPFFEAELEKSELGKCLFVFDNFETTQNPIEVFNWIDSFIRLPNKVLITTRLRDFKGDYPVEVKGMTDQESRMLIEQTAHALKVTQFLTETYTVDLIKHSEGHPYVIKVLLGEVSKLQRAANIPQLVAGTEDILTALFERTYASLSPCAQRALLTLSAWNSPVPRLVLEALLIHSTGERSEVEKGVESLVQFSIAEIHVAPTDGQEFISLPLVASVFGKKKLNISPAKAAINSDVEVLRMLGATQRGDVHLGLASRLEQFLKGVSRRIDKGEKYESFAPVIEAVCRAYNQGWLLLARWHMEQRTKDGYEKAKDELNRFLESGPTDREAAQAWLALATACCQTNDTLGEVHALIERAQIASVPFQDISSTANAFNLFLKQQTVELDKDQKRDFVERLARVMHDRISEANAHDLSRMAWLHIHLKNESNARDYVKRGLQMDNGNPYLVNLADKLGVPLDSDTDD